VSSSRPALPNWLESLPPSGRIYVPTSLSVALSKRTDTLKPLALSRQKRIFSSV